MVTKLERTLIAILCIGAISATAAVGEPAPAAPQRIVFAPQADALQILADGRPLATYVYRDPEILRPYFKDVCAPSGVQVTRRHPPKEGVDRTDHATMHPGLWLAFGDLGGADFWRNKTTVKHAAFVEPPQVAGDIGTFTVRNRYMAEGIARGEGVPPLNRSQDAHDSRVAICEEVCTYTFQVRPSGYLILWDSTFQTEQSGLYFGDQEEMGLGVRVATPLAVKPYQDGRRPGRILDDQGRLNEKQIWGRQAAWCDYSGWIGQTFAGIMVMPDPRNVTACRWHTRDYGFMAANPFGQAVFKAGPARKTEIAPGQPFHLRFAILIHAAPSENDFDPPAAYQDYLQIAAHSGPAE
jgi:hypothetical protein